ncbi:MAG TPA: hypothetical protein VGU71_06345 [Candidatus Dormibacteraeota bacterium]|nr:hypothetical protein [Candidatus Dormibacteraeota bacterium]
MGLVFTYLLIAALLAPVVWVMWWGVASLGGSARSAPRPRQASRVHRARSSFSFPQSADMTLPRHPGAIAICRLSDGAQIGVCKGPDRAGKCPQALADGTVPCAGSMLSLPWPIRGSTEWHIPFGYRTCLLGSYEVSRQPVSTP